MALKRGSFGGYEFSRIVLLFAGAACKTERHKARFSKVDEAD
jgi:hypothetical protein